MASLTEQIVQLPKDHWVNLQGLIDSANTCLSENNPDSQCTSISFLGKGGFHHVYRLVFSNGTQFAASIPLQNERKFNPQAKQSEIDTMKFVTESGLYPDIPVPKIHKYNISFSNPAGAPYVIMDIVEGITLLELKDEQGRKAMDALSHSQQLAVVKVLAKLKASLCRPVPFDQIGSLVNDASDDSESPSVGPLITLSGKSLGGPFDSAHELWKSILDHEIGHAVQEWCSNPEDEIQASILEPSCTPQAFTELYQLVSALVPEFQIPDPYDLLVLHHPDIALRNIFFDPPSLSTEEPKITGVIDWGGSQILPLMLSAKYPADLITTAGRVNQLFGRPNEAWSSVPANWTRLGDKANWPSYVNGGGEKTDWTPYVTDNIKQFYFRAYFSACFGEEISSTRNDATLAHRTVFMDAEFYMKFHEAVSGGWKTWVIHDTWIRETYNRLKALPERDKESEDLLIIGPNVYCNPMRPKVRDLRIFESDPRSDAETSDTSDDET